MSQALAQLDRGALAEIGTSSHPAEVKGDFTVASNSHRNNQGSYNTYNQNVHLNFNSPVVPDTLASVMNNLVINPSSSGHTISRSVITTASPTPAGDQSAEISEAVQTPAQTRFSTSEAPSTSTTPVVPVDANQGEEDDVGEYMPDIDVCIRMEQLDPQNVVLPNATGAPAKRYVKTPLYEDNGQSVSIWEPNPRVMPKGDDLGYAIYAGDIGRFDQTGSFRTCFNITFSREMNQRLGYRTPKNFRPFRSLDPLDPVLNYGHYTGQQFYAQGFDITAEDGERFKVAPKSDSGATVGPSVRVACIMRESRRTYVEIDILHWKALEKYISRYISDWETAYDPGENFKGSYRQLVIIGTSYRVSGFGSASSYRKYTEIKSMSATLNFEQHPPRWKPNTFMDKATFNSIDMEGWSEEAKREDRFGEHPPGHCIAVNAWKIVRKPPKPSLFSITSITSTASEKIQRMLSRR